MGHSRQIRALAGSRPCPETPKTGRSVDGCRSMQPGAALASGVSQQAFEHGTGIRVACVIAARVTPASEIPLDGAGPGDQVREGDRLVGRPVHVERAAQIATVAATNKYLAQTNKSGERGTATKKRHQQYAV